MTTYSLTTINGSTISDFNYQYISNSMGENNSSSSFEGELNNEYGMNTNKAHIGDEIIVYVDKDTAPVTKVFDGIIEDIKFQGASIDEKIKLSGRDYSLRMMDGMVEPEVYTNLQAGSIVKDIINKYTSDLTTGSVLISGNVIQRIAFNQMNVFDAVKKLSDLNGFQFYVDVNKDLHFEPKGSIQGSLIFDSGNVIKGDFKDQRDTVYNQIWVYGDRYLDAFKQTFTAGSPIPIGSSFFLLYNPSNTQITVSGAIIQPGEIEGMQSTIGSATKYLINYNDKRITFVSGTLNGLNIPSSGNSVVVDYYRLLPIVKVGDDESSKAQYGKRVKVIVDKDIKDPSTATAIMQSELSKSAIPIKEGNLNLKSVGNIPAGTNCLVNLPFHGINNQVYDIIEVNYDITKENLLSDKVMGVKLNRKMPDITDSIKDIMLNLKKIQSADISDTDVITRYQRSTGSLGLVESGAVLYSRPINDSFVLGHPINGYLGVVRPDTVGSLISGISFVTGCGIGYNRAIAGSRSWVFVKDANDVCNIGSKDSYSVSFWFAGSNIGSATGGWSISEHYEGTNYPWALRINNGSTFSAFIFDGATSRQINSISGLWVDGNWHHYVLNRNFGTDIGSYVAVYADNTLIGSVADTTNGNVKGDVPGFCFLTRSTADGKTKAINGSLDDFRVYNKLLTTNEIGSLYSKVNYPTDHLLAYYKFDEGVGSFCYNSASVEMPTGDAIFHSRLNVSGQSVIEELGTIGSPSVAAGIFWSSGVYNNGSCMQYSGTAGGFCWYSPDYLNFQSGQSFTIAAWCNVDKLAPRSCVQGIIGKGTTNTCNYALYISSTLTTNKIVFGERSGTTTIASASSSDIGSLNWHHAVGVYNADNFTNQIFIDGNPGSIIDTGGSAFCLANGSFFIGRNTYVGGNAGSELIVSIDEARVYNRALSNDEIYNLYIGKTIQPLLGDRRGGSTILWSGNY